MAMKKLFAAVLPLAVSVLVIAQAPKPTAYQLAWHEQEFYLFAHFGPNTFTGKEWGHGDEPEDIFNPTGLNTDQWCRIAKAAGAKGIIITAKHHDGFCLWPSKYSKHTVRESKWKNGKGDVVGALAASCKKYGLKFGVYISPWDRNHPDYGTDKYNDVYINTMKELFAEYGPIWELWWDGANGEGPNGKKQVYDFGRFEKTVRGLSPSTIVFSDIGPDIRWVGNESGFVGKTNWNTLDTAGFKRGAGGPPTDTLNTGNSFGKHWIPGECDVSIRPGWFYHKEEDEKVKTPEQLFQLYLKSVGRGANLLLNVPPDPRGLIHPNDSAALMGFAKLRQQFKSNLALKAKATMSMSTTGKAAPQLTDGNRSTGLPFGAAGGQVSVKMTKPAEINTVILYEDLRKGQAVSAFSVNLLNAQGQTIHTVQGTTIGRKRILTFPASQVAEIVLQINGQHFASAISELEAYRIDESLIEK
jgi:alpha-L-fucosidase